MSFLDSLFGGGTSQTVNVSQEQVVSQSVTLPGGGALDATTLLWIGAAVLVAWKLARR